MSDHEVQQYAETRSPEKAETRYRWQQIDTPPEGWRRCDYSEFSRDGEVCFVLYTDAPKRENPHRHNTCWVRLRRIVQQRYVTEWEDVIPHVSVNDGTLDDLIYKDARPNEFDGNES